MFIHPGADRDEFIEGSLMSMSVAQTRQGALVADSIWSVVQFLLLFLAFQTLVGASFFIPSGSMKGTLLVGDHIFATKYSYGYSRFSLPFVSPPLFSGRLFGVAPQRGDVVVFRPPHGTDNFIKRLIGLPGDRIQMIGGRLFINGAPVKRERVADFVDDESGRPRHVRRWRETLPNGVSYETLDLEDNGPLDDTGVYVVPPGNYFMMGDNRDNSADSRVPSVVGFVPFENLIAKARIIVYSLGDGTWQFWNWPGFMRWDRLLTFVR
jgi:signal peptidase I